MELFYTARFLRGLKKLSPEIQSDLLSSIEDFKDKENHKKLGLHKLQREMRGYHAFSSDFYYRIVIKMVKDKIYFMDVGTQDVYK